MLQFRKIITVFVLTVTFLCGSATVTQAAALTTDQIDAIIQLLVSFGADQSIVDNVHISLTGGTPITPTPQTPSTTTTSGTPVNGQCNLNVPGDPHYNQPNACTAGNYNYLPTDSTSLNNEYLWTCDGIPNTDANRSVVCVKSR